MPIEDMLSSRFYRRHLSGLLEVLCSQTGSHMFVCSFETALLEGIPLLLQESGLFFIP
jgi:hypothetical protein